MNSKKIFQAHSNPETTCYSTPAATNVTAMFFENHKWVDTKGAANYLKISVGSLRNAVYRKQVIARKFRRRLYFKVSELNRLLENSTLI